MPESNTKTRKQQRDQASYARRREACRAAGLCLRCGKRPPEEGKTKCVECQGYEKTIYRSLESKGLCPRCCKDVRVPGRTLCAKCRHKDWKRSRRPGYCVKCGKPNNGSTRHCNVCLTRIKAQRNKQRREVIEHYGGKCTCCGESIFEFLQLDHINNDGAAHRKQIGKGMYGWVIRNGFPEGFQVLCTNCNLAKAHYGQCPHQAHRDVNNEPAHCRE